MVFMRIISLSILLSWISVAAAAEVPFYKPSSRSEAIDISSNAYGVSAFAPDALGIGEVAPNFNLPLSGGGNYSLTDSAANGPVAIIFYRGHW